MLRPRITPCLLVRNGGLVKTVQFEDGKYVGDPINAVRIFNEKEVDELIVLDIDATTEDREPDYELMAKLAAECRMPLCYGGGIKTTDQIERAVALGAEKVAIGSAAVETPELIPAAAERVGGQSVVVVIDARRTKRRRRYEVYTHNGARSTGLDPAAFAEQAEELGAGEVLLNAIDRDGTMKGYDHELIAQVQQVIGTPLTVLGGAGTLDDIEEVIRSFGIIGAAAGSLFVFKGKYRAVLINYPNRQEKDQLVQSALASS